MLESQAAGACTNAVRANSRQSPAYDDEPEMNADQERIEIPAFLRRQAN